MSTVFTSTRSPLWTPHRLGWVCGVVLAAWIGIAGVLGLLQLHLRDLKHGHRQLLDTMQSVQHDIDRLLTHLNQHHTAECSADNLNRLRSLLFEHRHARQIGLLDAEGRLFCSTSIGALEVPVYYGSEGIDGAIGRYHLQAPIPLAGLSGRGTVVERGRFQVVMDGWPVQAAFQRHADAVWAGAGAQRRRVYVSTAGQGLARAAPDTPTWTLHWDLGLGVLSTTQPGPSPVTAQSVVTPMVLMRKYQGLLIGGLAVCLTLAGLSQAVIRRRIADLSSIDHRIKTLCAPDHVVCHYQPVVELATGRVVGCEVLARLQDGDTLLYPDRFIPALLKRGLAWRFDAAVSQRALEDLGQHLPDGSDFTVALNFFPGNLRHDRIHPHIQRTLQTRPRQQRLHIELEVTEYEFRPEHVPELHRLQQEGYLIAMDDFGTGYSNLGMVKRVAPDILKIDKSFVCEMEDTTLRSSLIPEIMGIARAVGSRVVAEGIENAAQIDRLLTLGVHYGQGYHYAKPMPLADFLAYLAQPRPT